MDWQDAQKVEAGVYKIPGHWLRIEYYDALNVLYRIENALRMYVYVILKRKYKGEWDKQCIKVEDNEQGTIESISKKRKSQARSFGYIGFSATCGLTYLTSGELTRLITSDAYWSLFKEGFATSREIAKLKLDEVSSIRNEMAHFRAIKSDDVAVIRTNARQLMGRIEGTLSSILNTNNTVPTNSDEEWYKRLKTINNKYCSVAFMESRGGEWIKLVVRYANALVEARTSYGAEEYRVLTVRVPAILMEYEKVRKNVIFMNEVETFAILSQEGKRQGQVPSFYKQFGMVFGLENIRAEYERIMEELINLFAVIEKESELIKKDNLATGKIVNLVELFAFALGEGEKAKRVDTSAMEDPERDTDSPEWWGKDPWVVGDDFISDTRKFPWIPREIAIPWER